MGCGRGRASVSVVVGFEVWRVLPPCQTVAMCLLARRALAIRPRRNHLDLGSATAPHNASASHHLVASRLS
jgi:hypothetical protein